MVHPLWLGMGAIPPVSYTHLVVNTNTGAVVTNAGISSDNELILTFSDGTIKNLGSVMGKDGAVYVPHISAQKILTFTIEEEPGEIPEPVDLNPNDEWSEIEGDGVVTDLSLIHIFSRPALSYI